jgi:hypothetical protein
MLTGNFRILRCVALASLSLCAVNGAPPAVRHNRGFIHGFVVLKDAEDKTLASGEVIQTPSGTRLNGIMTLHFKDGSLYQETTLFSQRRVFQLLKYKQVQKGPSFKRDEALSLDTATGNVSIRYTDKDGKEKTISDHLALPPDLANGIVPTLMGDLDPKVETTLSMLVSTPKPRVVKLKISASNDDSYSIGGISSNATHYVIKIDIGGITGVAAKVVGKQPLPVDLWVTKDAPTFLRSDGPLYEDGPIWRIELASPVWSKAQSVVRPGA